MLKLVKLELDNFRSFRGHHEVDFEPNGGLVLISGQYDGSPNLSSGSGKSSIILAIAYALGVCDIPATELINKYEKNLSVSLFLTNESGELIEVRRRPKLSILVNGQDISGMSSDLEGYLDTLVGVPRNLLRNIVFRMQRTQGSFINFTDSQKKEFLAATLGLNELESASEKLNADIKNKETMLSNLQGQIMANEKHLSSCLEPDESEVLSLQTQISDLERQVSEDLKNSESSVDAELRTVSQNLAQLTAQYESLNSIIAEQSGIKSKASVLAYNIKKTAERICPTCTQDWPDSQSALERMKSELELLLNTYKNNIAKLAALPQVKSDIDAMQSKYRELYAKKSELSSASASRATLLRSLNAQMAAINQAKINRQRALEQLSLAKKQASALEKDIEVDRLAAQAIGRSGFLGVFFAEVLSEIASEANSLMAKIPNVQDLTVSFSTETITKSGATKNQISTNLYKAGVPVVYKNLSGGQQSSLELCVDLALRSVVLRRNGIQLNFAAMDEALDGLDTENKYAALEVIKTNIAGTVLVIDHATEIKELFSQIVNVYYDGASSRTMYEKAQASA